MNPTHNIKTLYPTITTITNNLLLLLLLILNQIHGITAPPTNFPPTTFRSNLYLGLRTTQPDSSAFMLGIGYFKGGDVSNHQIRYGCYDQDGLHRWGWTRNDGKKVGLHEMEDPRVGITITAETLQFNSTNNEWSWRINTSYSNNNNDKHQTTNEQPLSMLITLSAPKLELIGTEGDFSRRGIRGQTSHVHVNKNQSISIDWGVEEIHFPFTACSPLTERLRRNHTPPEFDRTHFVTYRTSPTKAWRVMNIIRPMLEHSHGIMEERIKQDRSLEEASRRIPLLCDCTLKTSPAAEVPFQHQIVDANGDISVIVVQRVLRIPSSIIITSKNMNKDSTTTTTTTTNNNNNFPTSNYHSAIHDFDMKFEKAFNIIEEIKRTSFTTEVAKRAVSNLIGSISYFYGSNLLRDPSNPTQILMTEPGMLLTGVPSRAFFPRGFFWDEGFHQLVVARFDTTLAIPILDSWFDRFHEGWVAREQILGDEALERVPEQFRVQDFTYWNPPTFILALEEIFHGQTSNNNNNISTLNEFRKKALSHLKQMHEWVIRTQQTSTGNFVWRGRSRDGRHTLTSGIDDYPRGRGERNLDQEAHVDLLSWIIWLEDYLIREAKIVKGVITNEELIKLQHQKDTHNETLHQVFWNTELGFFNDVGWIDSYYPQDLPHPNHNNVKPYLGLVPHIGYVGLIPFCLQLISVNDVGKLSAIVEALSNTNMLRAPGIGIRSLAANDPLFGKDEDYWRGAIWVNINYLTIRALEFYAKNLGANNQALKQTMNSLRISVVNDLVSNIVKQYKDFGFVFENYHSTTGLGRGTKPFTGWTSLMALFIGGDDLNMYN
jgi:hypothetical protein